MGDKFSKPKCESLCRQAQARMGIHRNKKMNVIAKNKDQIVNHMKAQQDANAKIWCETLMNDENTIICFDILATMLDQLKGRLDYMEKLGHPRDMDQTYASIIHCAPKLEVEELMGIREQL